VKLAAVHVEQESELARSRGGQRVRTKDVVERSVAIEVTELDQVAEEELTYSEIDAA